MPQPPPDLSSTLEAVLGLWLFWDGLTGVHAFSLVIFFLLPLKFMHLPFKLIFVIVI